MSVNEDGVYKFIGWAVPGDRNVSVDTAKAEVSTIRESMAVNRVVGAAPEDFILAPGHRIVVVFGHLVLKIGLGKTFELKVGDVFDPMQHDSFFVGGSTCVTQTTTGAFGR